MKPKSEKLLGKGSSDIWRIDQKHNMSLPMQGVWIEMQIGVLPVDYYKLPTIFWMAIDNHRLKKSAMGTESCHHSALILHIFI